MVVPYRSTKNKPKKCHINFLDYKINITHVNKHLVNVMSLLLLLLLLLFFLLLILLLCIL